jgi:hypothetical protein
LVSEHGYLLPDRSVLIVDQVVISTKLVRNPELGKETFEGFDDLMVWMRSQYTSTKEKPI